MLLAQHVQQQQEQQNGFAADVYQFVHPQGGACFVAWPILAPCRATVWHGAECALMS